MNPLNMFILVVAVSASSSAQFAHPVPLSGSVDVNINGAVIAGPSGSVRTNNGLSGQGAAAQLSGPGGDVHTRAGVLALNGGGIGHAGVPAVAADLAAHNYLSAPGLSSHSILAASGVSPNILADPFSASHRMLSAPAYSHPILEAHHIAHNVATHGIHPAYLGGSDHRLDCGLHGLEHGIYGIGY